jgi:hypothetical protein
MHCNAVVLVITAQAATKSIALLFKVFLSAIPKLPSFLQSEQLHRQTFLKMHKVLVQAEDRQLAVYRKSANQKISVRSLNALPLAGVKKICCRVVVQHIHGLIWKGGQRVSQLVVLGSFFDTAEQLLAHWPYQRSARVGYKVF